MTDLIPKAKQIGTGVAAGGSTLLLVMNMFGARLDEMNHKIDEKNKQIKEYVDFQQGASIKEMGYLHEGQREIKELLKVIDGRLYKQRYSNSRGSF